MALAPSAAMRRVLVVALVIIGLAVTASVLAGVLRGGEPDTYAEQNLCESLDALQKSLEGLAPLAVNGSRGDLAEAFARIDHDWARVRRDAAELRTAEAAALRRAWNDFASAVHDASDRPSAGEALESIGGESAALLGAVQRAVEAFGCGPARG